MVVCMPQLMLSQQITGLLTLVGLTMPRRTTFGVLLKLPQLWLAKRPDSGIGATHESKGFQSVLKERCWVF